MATKYKEWWCSKHHIAHDVTGCRLCKYDDIIAPMEDAASEKQIGGEHYAQYAIQPTEFIHANDVPFIEGNVIKYVMRHRAKNGRQDIEKAIHYLELLLEWEYSE